MEHNPTGHKIFVSPIGSSMGIQVVRDDGQNTFLTISKMQARQLQVDVARSLAQIEEFTIGVTCKERKNP